MVIPDQDNEEVVIAEEMDDDASQSSGAATMLNLEELIKNHIDSIDKLKEELKTTREMYEDSFNNNPTYKEHVDQVKDVQRGKNSVRQQIAKQLGDKVEECRIAKQPSVATLEQKVKDVRFDISEKSKTLSDLLQDYKEQTGATSIETRNGQVLEIVSTSKLVRSKGSK